MTLLVAASTLGGVPRLPAAAGSGQNVGGPQRETAAVVRLVGPGTGSKVSSVASFAADGADQTVVSVGRVPEGASVIEYTVFSVEFRDAAARSAQFTDTKVSRIAGVHVLTAFERFADVFVADERGLEALKLDPGIVRVEEISRVVVPPPPGGQLERLESRATPDEIVRGGLGNLKGRGVIIAVVDTGVDFRHPDFITYDAANRPTSRLLYLWDTTADFQQGRGLPGPFAYPNRAPIGTLYTNRQLTDELRRRAVTIPATDTNGHGTACASVAAGNGNADRMRGGYRREEVVGVAPEADIIAVRVGTGGLENAYLLNAASEWLEGVAGNRPLVVSCSFGGQGGGHDGQSVVERQLDARFSPQRRGRALVVAAGNDAQLPIHSEVSFDKEPVLVEWEGRRDAHLTIYFNSGDDDIHVALEDGARLLRPLAWELNPFTKEKVAHLLLAGGRGGLRLYNTSGKKMRANLYLPLFDNRGRPAATFVAGSATPAMLVATPGTTQNAITVGSYDWNDNFHADGQWSTLREVCGDDRGRFPPLDIGKISCYSSPGPTRSGQLKPDLAAPGEWFTSSYAALPGGGGVRGWDHVDSTRRYVAMNGTSAATPYTSGVVALMFQRRPQLMLAEVKRLLADGVRAAPDPFTGPLPNPTYGHGKLNLAAVQRIFNALARGDGQRLSPAGRGRVARPRR